MNFGKKLKFLRSERGWSQNQLANKLNVARQTVSSWETANSEPSLDIVVKLCCVFNISSDSLLGIPPINDTPSGTTDTVMSSPEDSSISSNAPLSPNSDTDEHNRSTVDDQHNDSSVLLVDTDLGLDFLDWTHSKTKSDLKRFIISFSSLAIGLAISELEHIISRLTLPLVVLSLIALFSTPRHKMPSEFDQIESGAFILTDAAKKMIFSKKREYREAARINSTMFIVGLFGQAMWFMDNFIDNGWIFHNSMFSVLLVGILVLISICTPLSHHWHAICVLLHETAPQVSTPFDLDFWKYK